MKPSVIMSISLVALLILFISSTGCEPPEKPEYEPQNQLESELYTGLVFGIDSYRLDTDEKGALNNPNGVAIDETNQALYVADRYNNRIQRFDVPLDYLSASTIDYDSHVNLEFFKDASGEPFEFTSPTLLEVDEVNGDIYIYESAYEKYAPYQNNADSMFLYRINRFSSDGSFQWSISPFEELTDSPFFTINKDGNAVESVEFGDSSLYSYGHFLGNMVNLDAHNGYLYVGVYYTRNFSKFAECPVSWLISRGFIQVWDRDGNLIAQNDLQVDGEGAVVDTAGNSISDTPIYLDAEETLFYKDEAGAYYYIDTEQEAITDENKQPYSTNDEDAVIDSASNELYLLRYTEDDHYMLLILKADESGYIFDNYNNAFSFDAFGDAFDESLSTIVADTSYNLNNKTLDRISYISNTDGNVVTPDGIDASLDRVTYKGTMLKAMSAITATDSHVYVINTFVQTDDSDETSEKVSELIRFTTTSGVLSYKDTFTLPDLTQTSDEDKSYYDTYGMYILESGDAFEVYASRAVQNYIGIFAYSGTEASNSYTLGKFGSDINEFDKCADITGYLDASGNAILISSDGNNNRLHYITVSRNQIDGLGF